MFIYISNKDNHLYNGPHQVLRRMQTLSAIEQPWSSILTEVYNYQLLSKARVFMTYKCFHKLPRKLNTLTKMLTKSNLVCWFMFRNLGFSSRSRFRIIYQTMRTVLSMPLLASCHTVYRMYIRDTERSFWRWIVDASSAYLYLDYCLYACSYFLKYVFDKLRLTYPSSGSESLNL